jgi:transcriptional regulator with XRE-family HTH domain
MSMTPFQEFIREEMRRRSIRSFRGFAEFIDIAHTTINRIMSIKNPAQPSVDVLVKISKATGVDVRYILGLIAPDGIQGVTTDSMELMAQVNRLPKNKQKIILQLIESMLTENREAETE